MKKIFTLLFSFSLPLFLMAQTQSKLDIGLRYMEEQKEALGLTQQDVEGMIVSDNYVSKHNGVTHIYFNQTHKGIPIYNAIFNVNITKENNVPFHGNRFHSDVKSKVNTTKASIDAQEAVEYVAKSLDVTMTKSVNALEQISDIHFVVEAESLSNSVIPVKLKYQAMKDGTLRLVWDVEVDMVDNADYWSIRVDANIRYIPMTLISVL